MKYHIITYGCQMNKSDSEKIAGILECLEYQKTNKIDLADLVIVNMCSVRQSAVNRVYSFKKLFETIRIKNPNLKTALTGCFLPTDEKKFSQIFNFIFKIKDLSNLPNILIQEKDKRKQEDLKDYLSLKPKPDSLTSAYLPIMTGCNNFCSYCVVPFTRGREKSRPANDIIQEVKNLIKNGFKEIILLGQNVNSYQDEKINFPKLLQMINDIPGNFWIRFITSHPKDLSDELIKTMANCQKVTEYLHLPFQSGDNEILKKMNRGYTRQNYLKLIKKIKKYFSFKSQILEKREIALSTDIIVGFPGETKRQFKKTVKIMKKVKFDMAYLAKYSPRSGTTASLLKDDVPNCEKKRREQKLNKILTRTALKRNKKYLRKNIEILIERKEQNNIFGKTRTNKGVIIKNAPESLDLGQFINVKIIKVSPWNLQGIYQ